MSIQNPVSVIKPSCDSKVRAYKAQQNTFGLLPGNTGSCPGATTGCGGCWHLKAGRITHTCYVDKLMRAYKNVGVTLAANTAMLKSMSQNEMETALIAEFTRFQSHEQKRKQASALDYRIHWSGDIFSSAYADALTSAMAKFPSITFWMYTRSWSCGMIPEAMVALPNLQFFISLDAANADAGINWLKALPLQWKKANVKKVRISYMGNDCPDCLHNYMEDNKLRKFSCPVDSGKMTGEGACTISCRFCIKSNTSVLFFAL